MDVNAAWDTKIAMLPEIEPCVAVTVIEPAFKAVNIPEALRDANVASEAFQVTCEVRVAVVPSLYLPVAANCRVEPAATEAAPELVTAIDMRVGEVELVFCELLLLPPPHPARPRQRTKTEANIAPKLFILAILFFKQFSFRAHQPAQFQGLPCG
jgi:hypothetical protein